MVRTCIGIFLDLLLYLLVYLSPWIDVIQGEVGVRFCKEVLVWLPFNIFKKCSGQILQSQMHYVNHFIKTEVSKQRHPLSQQNPF